MSGDGLSCARAARRAALAVVGFAVLMATVVPAADAYRIEGKRWPGRTAKITYWNGTPYRAELAAAVRAWNRSGVRVRFVAASRARAKVRITSYGPPEGDRSFGASGRASVGYRPRAFIKLSRAGRGAAITGVIAHELGHVLGLNHETRRCGVMNSVPWTRCGSVQPCTILQTDDLRGALRRYGGRLRKGRAELCPPPPLGAVIEAVPGSYRAQARFRMPEALSVAGYAVSVGVGSCPDADVRSVPSYEAEPGKEVTFDVTPFPNPLGAAGSTLCARIWTLGEGGRASSRAATVQGVYRPEEVPAPSGFRLTANVAGIVVDWAAVAHQQARHYEIAYLAGETCPASPEAAPPSQRRSVPVPSTTIGLPVDPGRYCVAIWTRDSFGRLSTASAAAVVDSWARPGDVVYS